MAYEFAINCVPSEPARGLVSRTPSRTFIRCSSPYDECKSQVIEHEEAQEDADDVVEPLEERIRAVREEDRAHARSHHGRRLRQDRIADEEVIVSWVETLHEGPHGEDATL